MELYLKFLLWPLALNCHTPDSVELRVSAQQGIMHVAYNSLATFASRGPELRSIGVLKLSNGAATTPQSREMQQVFASSTWSSRGFLQSSYHVKTICSETRRTKHVFLFKNSFGSFFGSPRTTHWFCSLNLLTGYFFEQFTLFLPFYLWVDTLDFGQFFWLWELVSERS